MQPSVQDCVDMIKLHNVLPDWSDIQVANAVFKALQDCAFTYTTNTDGKLDGLCLARWDNETSLHIMAMIAPGKVWNYLRYLRKVFPKTKHITFYRSKTDLQFKQLNLR